MGKDIINIDGEEYYNKSFMATLERVFFDYFHIVLHRKNIEIKGKMCFMCGEEFKPEELTKHHTIPKELSSVFNVYIPFCRKCHEDFNKYLNSKKKPKKKKIKGKQEDRE